MYYILRDFHAPAKTIGKLNSLRKIAGIAPLSENTIDEALQSDWKDFEDAIQHFAALEVGCTEIITRNVSDFKSSLLPVFTPKQFLEKQ